MQYEDQLVIGTVFNTAIQEVLTRFGIDDPDLLGALAREILVRLDQSGHFIAKKWLFPQENTLFS